MKKEDESYESVNLSNTTTTKPGWLLYYILKTYQLIKSISGKREIDFGQVRARHS